MSAEHVEKTIRINAPDWRALTEMAVAEASSVAAIIGRAIRAEIARARVEDGMAVKQEEGRK